MNRWTSLAVQLACAALVAACGGGAERGSTESALRAVPADPAMTVQLRVLLSAADAGRLWDLRCHVREQLILFLQRNYP